MSFSESRFSATDRNNSFAKLSSDTCEKVRSVLKGAR
jgi:hypothetical protein